MNTKDFENKVMGRIEGQTPLPQSMFRQFLEWLDAAQSSDLSAYQKSSDDTLSTTAKTVVGAINEIKSALPTLTFAVDDGYLIVTSGDKQYKVELTEVTE